MAKTKKIIVAGCSVVLQKSPDKAACAHLSAARYATFLSADTLNCCIPAFLMSPVLQQLTNDRLCILTHTANTTLTSIFHT